MMSHVNRQLEAELPDENATHGGEPEHVLSCEACCAEIPGDEAITEEATEYVMHFCGIDCYDAWHKRCGNGLNLDHRKE